jgi:hypothetical protein
LAWDPSFVTRHPNDIKSLQSVNYAVSEKIVIDPDVVMYEGKHVMAVCH